MSIYDALHKRVNKALAAIHAARRWLRFPSYIRYDQNGAVMPEYQEAVQLAEQEGIHLKAYGSLAGFDPDKELFSEIEPSPAPSAIEFTEWSDWPEGRDCLISSGCHSSCWYCSSELRR